ncbi:winged helix-turn-helix transcriptional regulator [Aeromicrobium ginsengisoli]|uniref:winged helix-turn-helix transcriptional regulator n=1 Tax=Aeromicrobium ginsengisoli TaxID=363867 RepID=UPI00165F88C7|nr:winged helix-turn-helix transcriptional regulator [Aeromicrobium ginsengisoli]
MTARSGADGRRLYGQGCPLACALDVLGERWTLLVIRELLLGPKRFTELGTALPAAGPNRLTTRLRRLQEAGVAEKTPAGAYALTAYGEGLREPVIGLGLWGLGLMPDIHTVEARPDMVALVMSGAISPTLLSDLEVDVEVTTPEVFTMSVRDGRMVVRSGPSGSPATSRLRCISTEFIDLSLGAMTLSDKLRSGDVQIDGDVDRVSRLFDHFAVTAHEHLSHA